MAKLSQLNLLQIYRNWRQGAGVFEGLVRATPFVSLQHYPDFELELTPPNPPQSASEKALISLIDSLSTPNILVLLDLPGQQAVWCAYTMQTKLQIKPILLLANPMHAQGLVGSPDLIRALLAGGEHLPLLQASRGFALILDYTRFDDYPTDFYQQSFNNQYELTEDDLPDFDLLKLAGIKGIAVITTTVIKADLANYLDYLKDQGLDVLVKNSWESGQIDE